MPSKLIPNSSETTLAHDELPKPLLRLELRDLRHESTKTFLTHVDAVTDISHLVSTVIKLLYYPAHAQQPSITSPTTTTTTITSSSSTRQRPHKPAIPGTRSITLIPRSIDGVAYTTGLDIDSSHKEIHFSLSYIEHVQRTSKTPAAIRTELLGVICHELAHCPDRRAASSAPARGR